MSPTLLQSGDLVAALVKQSGEERWIVAEAVAFKHGKYEVEDIDVKEANRNFTLDKKFVKPLPLMRADPLICPEAFFPCNTFGLYNLRDVAIYLLGDNQSNLFYTFCFKLILFCVKKSLIMFTLVYLLRKQRKCYANASKIN